MIPLFDCVLPSNGRADCLLAVYGIGPRLSEPGLCTSARSGSTPGANTLAESMSNGLDWAVVINTRDFPPHVANQDPFLDILYSITIPNFLTANPTV
jgi:hypothetical protein